MSKEPLGLYFLRLFISCLLVIGLGMLYWSSLLVEERLREISQEISELKNDITSLPDRSYASASTEDSLNGVLKPKKRAHIDESLPNLLSEDPFYIKTLPEILGKGFVASGTFRNAVIGRPDNLHPFSNWSQVSSWQDRCSVSLAQLAFGRYDSFAPEMAIKIEARPLEGYQDPDAVEFWIHLRDDIFWQPLKPLFFSDTFSLAPLFLKKHQVTAEDFVFYFNALSNPHVEEPGAVALRTYYDDVESIRAVDPLTLVVRWKVHAVSSLGEKTYKIKYQALNLTGGLKPLPRFVFQHFSDGSKIIDDKETSDVYRTSAIWAQNFSNHWARNVIVSCGPWIFEGMTEREIKFKRNKSFPMHLAALADEEIIQFKETSEAIWQNFKGAKIDSYVLQPDQLLELKNYMNSKQYQENKQKGENIERLDYLGRSYSYIGWNQAKPFFASRKVRQALTMAIDRERIISQNLNGLGIEITSPFYRYSSSYDTSIQPWPYDPEKARKQLEEEGWYDSDNDGVIDKLIDGKLIPFRFSLTYFVKNSVNKSICEYIATALKELGIDCTLNGVDVADLSAAFDDKTFDAISLGWALSLPPEDPKQLWYSSGAKEKGSSNAVGFANAEADQIIDALQFESDPEKRKNLYYRFDAIIHEEAPYTFLYTPKTIFLYYDYLKNVFIPQDRQDLIPGANIAQPISSAFWLEENKSNSKQANPSR